MKIGNKEFPDACPNCGEIKGWIRKPNCRIKHEPFGHSYSCFSITCLNCKYETPVVKIREDYLKEKEVEIEDVTPYKHKKNYTLKIIIRVIIILVILYVAGVALNLFDLIK